MSLNAFRDKAGAFLNTVDPAGEEPVPEIIRMLGDEYATLEASLDNPVRHMSPSSTILNESRSNNKCIPIRK
jgi:hypothetical protein